MKRALVIRREAEADILDAASWFESQSAGLGLDFVDEVGTVLHQITDYPFAWPRVRLRPHVRRALVQRFHFRVFYIVRIDAIVAFAVIHGARHDREWRNRV